MLIVYHLIEAAIASWALWNINAYTSSPTREKLLAKNFDSFMSGKEERGYTRANNGKSERIVLKAPAGADEKKFFRKVVVYPFV